MEKLIKMTNPNYKVSNSRILMKYVNRKLSVEQIRSWIYSLFEGHVKAKKLKTLKLLKDIKILSENDIPKGFVFIEFVNPEKALHFIRTLVQRKDETLAEIGNSKGETPIIEFAFDDVKKLRKIEDLKKKQKEELNKTENNAELDEKANIDKKQFQKELQSNRKLMAKKLVNDALQQNNEVIAKQAVESINGLRSRGLKQRLFKKLEKKFAHLVPTYNTQEIEEKKEVKPVPKQKKIEKLKKVVKPDENVLKVKQDIKNKNKKLRREKNQEINKPDEFETNFIKKVQKKAKWSETA